MHTPRIKTLTKRRLILAAVIIIAAILQNGTLSAVNLHICLLLPLTVILAMFEKETAGMFFGLLGGCLWDISSASVDGMKALFLTLTGCICGLLVRYIMRNNLLTALSLSGVITVLFHLLHWLFYVVPNETGMFSALLQVYMPQILLTILATPVLYFLIRATEKKFRT